MGWCIHTVLALAHMPLCGHTQNRKATHDHIISRSRVCTSLPSNHTLACTPMHTYPTTQGRDPTLPKGAVQNGWGWGCTDGGLAGSHCRVRWAGNRGAQQLPSELADPGQRSLTHAQSCPWAPLPATSAGQQSPRAALTLASGSALLGTRGPCGWGRREEGPGPTGPPELLMQGQRGPVLGGRWERRAPGSQGPPLAPSTPAHGGLP